MRRSWLTTLLLLPGLALANPTEETTETEVEPTTEEASTTTPDRPDPGAETAGTGQQTDNDWNPPGRDEGQTASNTEEVEQTNPATRDRGRKVGHDDATANLDPKAKALTKMHKIHQHEIQMGLLGQRKASDPQVKEFARTLEQDHTSADLKLGGLAINEGVDLEQTMATMKAKKGHGEHEDQAARLDGLEGQEFDREFLTMMVEGHEKAKTKLTELRGEVQDEQVLALIDETLPSIERHLARAKALQTQLGQQASN